MDTAKVGPNVWPPALQDDPDLAVILAGVSAVTALQEKGVRVSEVQTIGCVELCPMSRLWSRDK